MKRSTVFALFWLMSSVRLVHADAAPEFRGVWVTRFEWATPNPAECRRRITQILEHVAARNFNAVVFQIRGEADTLYPSTFEPWSQLIGGKDPGFDPVALAIEEAHRHGLEFHAYMNPMPLRSLTWRGAPEAPNHLWHRHGPDSTVPWVCVDQEGRPAREEYYYLAAGIPDVQAYLRNVIIDVVRRYAVDGIHLDRIRYPGAEYSYDPISRKRFAGRGNPELLEYGDWQRRELSKFINDLAAEMRAEKPEVVLSCSAWGIYNRHNIEEYDGFSSGFHDFYQDTWDWCRIGAMDLLVPMIYWNLGGEKPDYDELLADFVRGVGGAHVAGGQRMFSPDENIQQTRLTREAGAAGTVLFSYRSAQRRGIMEAFHRALYQEKAPTPRLPRLTNPEHGTVLGTVLADDGNPLVDACVSLKRPASDEGERSSRSRGNASEITWTSSADGRFAFHQVPPGPVRIVVRYEFAPTVESEPITVQPGAVARVELKVPQASELREQPFVSVLRPTAGFTTPRDAVHVLGRTTPGNHVRVAGKDVDVFATGAFAADNVPLQPGENRIEITVSEGEKRVTRTLVVNRSAPAPTAQTTERPPTAQPDTQAESQELWTGEKIRIAETTPEQAGITYGLHSVRLGGPWLAHVPAGTRLEVIGRQERNCRVRLSASMTGWVSEGDLKWLPDGTPPPHNSFTSCEVSGTSQHDTLSLAMSAPVVVAVRSDIDPSNRLYIDFFNTHHAATWLSHKSGAKIIGPVRVEQIETDHVRLTLPIRSRQIWGYSAQVRDGRFTLQVRRPPTIATAPNSPLKGLLVAVEAGHGGSNHGARGLLGTREKTVNLAGAQALQHELERRGARVVQVRRRDESISLGERVERTNAAGADLFVSVHANSAGSTRGYLSVSGTSTYYHGIHCQPMAYRVYQELLKLGWGEFGVVGNFSYAPLRNTLVPSILVEQAFMSHPGDEARLLDPAYQREQAAAITNGLEAFLDAARE